MDHTVASFPEVEGIIPANFPLGISSGNAQSLLVDTRDGIENQTPSLLKQEPQFPIPAVKLGSNDGPDHEVDAGIKLDTARAYRPKVLCDPKRPFLQNPKYLEWLGRQRQEFGDDGKPVWSAEVEAAFQDGRASVSITGRPLTFSQRSLISHRWGEKSTLNEAGCLGEICSLQNGYSKRLVRKGNANRFLAISKSLTVFSKGFLNVNNYPARSSPVINFFQGDILIKPSRLSLPPGTGEGRKYYHNSIEHMVKQQKATKLRTRAHLLQRHRSSSNDGDTEWDICHPTDVLDANHLHRMNFEMWVSFPDQPEHALHKYTNLQTATETITPMPLEELIDWRLSFPHLQNSMEEGSSTARCEIILLNTSFQLMDNFPPRHSKLGIGLELEFGAQDWKSTVSAPDEPNNWYSITYIYQNGEQVREPMFEKCIVSAHGQVRPVFQSRWWASTFTSLTEIKKLAEDSKDSIAIHSAGDHVRGFFHSLTIMQEIWRCHAGVDGTNLGRRMAILLWKFSQAQAGFVGTTTWQKLIAPPHRLATNSPLPPASEMGLPPLALDTMIEGSPNHANFDRNDHFLEEPSLSWDAYRTTMEDEVCPDSFMPFKQDGSPEFSQVASTFANPAGIDLTFDQLYETSDHNHFGLQDSSGLEIHSQEDHTIEANLFEMPHLTKEETDLSHTHYSLLDHLPGSSHSPPISHGRPLARFDRKYHTVLQEQLGTDDSHHIHGHHQENGLCLASEHKSSERPLIKIEPDDCEGIQDTMNMSPNHHEPWVHVDEHDEALRSALLAVSAASAVDNSQPPIIPHSLGQDDSQYVSRQQSQTPRWESPLAFRPPLQSHHSFPGLDYPSAADDTFALISNPHSLSAQEQCLQPTFPDEDGYLDTNSQTGDACAPTSTRTRSEPDLSTYQSAELDIAQLHHPPVAPRPQTQESNPRADSLEGVQAFVLFPSHGSDSPLQDRSGIPHIIVPDFRVESQIDKAYAEVKMEDLEA